MGFSMIVPTPKAKTGTFKISTVSMRGGPFRLQISIPSALFTLLFKQAERFDLLVGDNGDKGKLMLKPSDVGHFKPTFMKHTVIFRLPETAWTPQIALAAEDPKRREVEGGRSSSNCRTGWTKSAGNPSRRRGCRSRGNAKRRPCGVLLSERSWPPSG
ncbi:hypothetical protein PPF1_80 [Rhizobium phage vB_RleM_PPF1]|uniref:hypothetical protein n=1 Tax=Rhizobium phage vB_RleM_PPF1 TaxID=1498228 RepID=UPI00049A7F6D|nr:hypothetical protein PPF1_80 [Rhizobium phage vB_RleM_PPF1]AID18393.1 hypothetical protein PPF1_80 [Rhizobium phage vB_RleM_PPF1]